MTGFATEAFALCIHTRRFMAGQKMAELAAAAGVSKAALGRAERKQSIGIGTFLKLCRHFGEDPRAFLVDDSGRPVAWDVSRETPAETPSRQGDGGGA